MKASKNRLQFLSGILAFFSISATAQQNVGIGTITPNAKSVLELVSPGNNQGFLMPRLSTAQRTAMALTAAENGMTVYDNTLNQFFYWNGTTSTWNAFGSVLSGGAANKLAFWTGTGALSNNTNLHWDNTNQFLGVGTALPAAPLDVVGAINSSTNYRIGNSIVLTNRGTDNIYVGKNAGNATSTGTSNTFVGANTGVTSSSGSYNTAIGEHAGFGLSTGFANSIVGEYAGVNLSTGKQNVILGSDAGTSVSTSDNVTLIGYNADLGSSTQRINATAIGYNAKVDADNSLILGGTGTAAVNVGIGTTAPNYRLTLHGSFGMLEDGTSPIYYTVFRGSDQTANIVYRLPAAQASAAGQVLTNDGTGTLAWANTSSGLSGTGTANQIAFWNAAGTDVTSNTGIQWDNTGKQLGINVAPGSAKLHINDAANSQGDMRITAGTATGTASNDGLAIGINTASAYLLNYESTALTFGTAGATRVTLSSTGDLGIGVAPTAGNKLEVNGKTVTSSFQMTASPGVGYVLTSDLLGNATWTSPTSVLAANAWAVGGNALLPLEVGKLGTTSSNDLSIMTNSTESIRILASGEVGIGTASPSTTLHVKGKMTIENGSEGEGKVLVSDANGVSTWKQGSYYTVSGLLNIASLAVATTTYRKIEDAMTFVKNEDETMIEITLTSPLFVNDFNTANLITFEVRIDDLPTILGTGTTSMTQLASKTSSSFYIYPGVIYAVFPKIAAGNHKVSIWCKTDTGTADNVYLDFGGYSSKIVVKEAR